MSLFENQVGEAQYEQLDAILRGLYLNDPWSIGKLSNIIELRAFETKEDWEAFYFRMGDIRVKELSRLDREEVEVLENDLLANYDAEVIDNLSWQLKNINYQNGRTVEQLKKKANTLKDYAAKQGIETTADECYQVIHYSVIGSTWNEAVTRVENTIVTLKERFPKVTFIKKDGEFDRKYAVDFELHKKKELLCGIQIKPASYFRSFSPYIKRAKAIAAIKNQEYRQKHGRPVLEVISTSEGAILNHTILQELETYVA